MSVVMDRNGGQSTEGAYDGTTQTMATGQMLQASCHMQSCGPGAAAREAKPFPITDRPPSSS